MYHSKAEKNEILHCTVHSKILHGPGHEILKNEKMHGTVHGTWRRLGLPRGIMNFATPGEMVLGSKRKPQSLPSSDEPLTDKKQKLLDLEAKALGKLMAENLESAVAARQLRRAQ